MFTRSQIVGPLATNSTEHVVSVGVFGPAQKVRYHVESVKLDFVVGP